MIIAYKVLKWFRVFKFIQSLLCARNELQVRGSDHRKLSSCWPCVNIYNQSYNNRVVPVEDNKSEIVKYDAEMERLYFPPTEQSRITGRKSIKSNDSRSSTPLRLTNV